MAQTSGFFNAFYVDGKYDRQYNAEHYSDNLAVVISNGVLRSTNDDLKPTANGLTVNIGKGRAWIEGKWYKNDNTYGIVVPTPPTANPRIDRVVLRLDKTHALNGRIIDLQYITGTAAAVPVPPTPVDNDNYKDLVLCNVHVGVNASSVTVEDTRGDASICGWVYSTSGDNSFFTTLDGRFGEWFEEKKDTLSSVTLFRQYSWRGTTVTNGQTVVTFDIPQYDPTGVDIIQVYFNGLLQAEGTDYTLNNRNITFVQPKNAGQEVVVVCYRSIDGTGLGTVADKLDEVEGRVDSLTDFTEYNYIATGNADNVALSEIAKAFFAGADDGSTMTVNIYGELGVTAPYSGSGTSADPYKWFELGAGAETSRRICFDFGNCKQILYAPAAGTKNIVFSGRNLAVKNLKLRVNGETANTSVVGFGETSGNILCESSVFVLYGNMASYFAATGTFRDCSVAVFNANDVGRCFIPTSDSFLRIFGGDYRAYAPTGRGAAAVYVAAAVPNAVVISEGVGFPTVGRTGYTQTHAIFDLAKSGKCAYFGSVTTLTVSADGQSVTATIAASKERGTW